MPIGDDEELTIDAGAAGSGSAPASPATTFAMTPSAQSVLVGVAVTITLTPDGATNAGVTVGASGGGLSGSQSTTFANTTPVTVNFTPTTSGVVTFTATNTGGLTNPSPVTVTAVASSGGGGLTTGQAVTLDALGAMIEQVSGVWRFRASALGLGWIVQAGATATVISVIGPRNLPSGSMSPLVGQRVASIDPGGSSGLVVSHTSVFVGSDWVHTLTLDPADAFALAPASGDSVFPAFFPTPAA